MEQNKIDQQLEDAAEQFRKSNRPWSIDPSKEDPSTTLRKIVITGFKAGANWHKEHSEKEGRWTDEDMYEMWKFAMGHIADKGFQEVLAELKKLKQSQPTPEQPDDRIAGAGC